MGRKHGQKSLTDLQIRVITDNSPAFLLVESKNQNLKIFTPAPADKAHTHSDRR